MAEYLCPKSNKPCEILEWSINTLGKADAADIRVPISEETIRATINCSGDPETCEPPTVTTLKEAASRLAQVEEPDHLEENGMPESFNKAAEYLLVDLITRLPLEAGMPKIDEDPFVALYEVGMGHSAPPRELWDTPEVRVAAKAEGLHPMAWWLAGDSVPSEPDLADLYDKWMREVHKKHESNIIDK